MNVKELHLKALEFNTAWSEAILAAFEGSTVSPTVFHNAADMLIEGFLWPDTCEGLALWNATHTFVSNFSARALCEQYPTPGDAYDVIARNGRL